MKYVLHFTWRVPGGEEHIQAIKHSLAVFEKWSPPDGVTIHQFIQEMGGPSGLMILEMNDMPSTFLEDLTVFGAWFEFRLVPVVDIDTVPETEHAAIERWDLS
jgi:hypothetical protein